MFLMTRISNKYRSNKAVFETRQFPEIIKIDPVCLNVWDQSLKIIQYKLTLIGALLNLLRSKHILLDLF